MTVDKKLTEYLSRQRWCNFKEEIRQNRVQNLTLESVPFDNDQKLLTIGKITLSLSLQDSETRYFMMPLAREENPSADTIKIGSHYYADALKKEDYWQKMMEFITQSDNQITFPNGWTLHYQNTCLPEVIEQNRTASSRPLGVEQSNTTLAVGDDAIAFKLERMLDFSEQLNPEFEMNEKLMREKCTVMPKTYGYFVLQNQNNQQASSGIIQEFVKNQGDLWNYSLSYLKEKLQEGYLQQTTLTPQDNPEFMALMQNLSAKTKEMSDSLSRPDNNPAFSPEPVDSKFIRIYGKQMEVLLYKTHRSIDDNLEKLPAPTKTKAAQLLNNWDSLTGNFISANMAKIEQSADKGHINRVHGDFHLGQVMVTNDKDLRIIDFAGEPDLPLEQRRQKHIYVRDIAGMYRSIKGYLGSVAVEEFVAAAPDASTADSRRKYATKAIKPLINESARTFLGEHSLKEPWLSLEVLRKNLYEVNYEVNNRPQMAYVAIDGLADLLQKAPDENFKVLHPRDVSQTASIQQQASNINNIKLQKTL